MNIGYFEDAGYERLLPLTWLRAAFELRCGCDRLIDKVRKHIGPCVARVWVRETIRQVIASRLDLDPVQPDDDWCLLNARVLVIGDVRPPPPGVAWQQNGHLVAAGVVSKDVAGLAAESFLNPDALDGWLAGFRVEPTPEPVRLMTHPWDLILANAAELRRQCRAGGQHLGTIDAGVHVLQPGQLFVGRGARVKPGAVLDAEDGPIHIDEDVLVEPNAVLEGPCYIGPGSIIRGLTLIRPGTTIGPVCKVGGEVEGSILLGHSNKQHEGFIGHSYVGSWVNLGAGTITSDLKNTYGSIRVAINGVGVETGQHFLGSFIGDHSKTGIGTILPTGCVLGVAANIFTRHTLPTFVPSFSWLTDKGMTSYRVEKAVQIARIVMERRDVELSDAEGCLLERTADLARQVEAAGWTR